MKRVGILNGLLQMLVDGTEKRKMKMPEFPLLMVPWVTEAKTALKDPWEELELAKGYRFNLI